MQSALTTLAENLVDVVSVDDTPTSDDGCGDLSEDSDGMDTSKEIDDTVTGTKN